MASEPEATAAFFRIEGVLVRADAVPATAYFAMHRQGFRERLLGLGQVALSAPVYRVLGQSDRVLANRLLYLALRGMSEDRVAELAEEYVEDMLRERILEGGIELMRKARQAGHRIVLIADGVSQIVDPLLKHLRQVDDCVCNRLEIRDGYATGKLMEPVIGGHDSARWARGYAAERGIDLDRSLAYVAHGPDLLLMTAVGKPCAVNSDFTLRRAAREADWPMLDYDV